MAEVTGFVAPGFEGVHGALPGNLVSGMQFGVAGSPRTALSLVAAVGAPS